MAGEEYQGEYEEAEFEEEAKAATEDIAARDGNFRSDAEAEEFAEKIIKRAASLKAVKINREAFLRAELKKHCPDIDVDLAIAETPAAAGVPAQLIDVIASEAIDFETKKCAGLSFLAGIPGGVALVGTVPADLAQYFAHVMRIEQKLAYLYGWQTFLNDADEVDDQTLMNLVVLMGVMLEVGGAANALTKFASDVAQKGVQKTIQRQALTKTAFYPILKKVLRVLGVQLTKESFSKTVSKVVPVIGGAVPGGLTYASFKPGAEKLRKYLRELPISGIDPSEPDGAGRNIIDEVAEGAMNAAQSAGSVVASTGKQVGEAAYGSAQIVGDAAGKGVQAAGKGLGEVAKGIGGFLGSIGKK